MYQSITEHPLIRKIDFNLVFLLSIPFILLAANQEWLFPYGNPSDAWVAKRYLMETGHQYPLTGQELGSMYENYKASRVSWNIKGLLVHHFFSPVTAQYVLHISMFCLLLTTFYLIVKNLFNKHIAFISSVAFGTYSQFHAVFNFEWDYNTHDGALNTLLTLLFMLLASQSKKWKLWLMLAGATWASALQSVYVGPYIPAIAFWYLYLNHKYLRHPIVTSALYILAGAVAVTLIYCIISYLIGGRFFFLESLIVMTAAMSAVYLFHPGYWFPFFPNETGTALLYHSKGIVLPLFAGITSIILFATSLIKKRKGNLLNAITLTQCTLLICLFAAFFLHFNGHGVFSNDHHLAFMAPFIFLSMAGTYAYFLRVTDATNPPINVLKAAVLVIFCGALIFGDTAALDGHLIEMMIFTPIQSLLQIPFVQSIFPMQPMLWWFSLAALMRLIFFLLVSAVLIITFAKLRNLQKTPLLTGIILTLSLSGFLSLNSVQTSSINISSYDITNKCGIQKDQYKIVTDLFLKLRPYHFKSEPVRKIKEDKERKNDEQVSILKEPLFWYKNNAVLKHYNTQCPEINLTSLYGGVLGIRGFALVKRMMLLDGYLGTESFSNLRAERRIAALPKQFRIAIFYSDQHEIQTALATLKSHGLKAKILDQGQIESGAISFNLMILDLKKNARTKAKYRN